MSLAQDHRGLEPAEKDARRHLVVSGTYRLLEKLGAGSSGEVYAAEHLRLGLPVAVKLLRSEVSSEPRAVRRFHREARALASLQSRYVVGVLDCGELADGTPYLVMERLKGEDLRALLARAAPLTVRRSLHIALDACRGLSIVHRAGLVHRDIKPGNLFLTRDENGEEQCKILDFGVAKQSSTDMTQQGTLIGTIRYMAPEQLTDGASVGPAADIYAIGAILYQCLTGKPVHDAPTLPELMFRILNVDPPRLGAVRPQLPRELCALVGRALARDPAARFRSAEALAAELGRLIVCWFSGAVTASAVCGDGTEADGEAVVAVAERVRAPGRWRASLALCVGVGAGAWGASVAMNDDRTQTMVASPAPRPVELATQVVHATVAPTLPARSAVEPDALPAEREPAKLERPPRSSTARASAAAEIRQPPVSMPHLPARVVGFDNTNPYAE